MLEVKNLCYSYSEKIVLNNISFVSHPGTISILLGSSGIGKTTLFRLIARFLSPTEGSILWSGQPIDQRNVAYMQQKSTLLPWRSVLKNIYLHFELGNRGQRSPLSNKKFDTVVEKFHIADLLFRYPDELSEGQKQRVSLACQCLSSKPILLLDEPFSALDIFTKESLYSYILQLARQENKAILLVTHDIRDAVYLGDRFYILKEQAGLSELEWDRSKGGMDYFIEVIRNRLLS